MPRPRQGKRETLTKSEAKALLRSVRDNPTRYAMFLLIVRSGLRSNELRSLDVRDIDKARSRLTVRAGKGRGERQVPIGVQVVKALEDHLAARPDKDEPAMFPTRSSGRISNRHLRNVVKGQCAKAGIGADWHPQALIPLFNLDDPEFKSSYGGDDEDDEPDVPSVDLLAELLDEQRAVLISVATGGASPEQADDGYRDRQDKLTAALRRIGQPNPFPWPSLWEWHTFYARRLGTHDERRLYVDRLAQRVLIDLPIPDDRSPGATLDTWRTVDRRMRELREALQEARSLADFQDVGHRCRQVMIAAANTLFDESMVGHGEVVPYGSNAKDRMDIVLRNVDIRPELRRLLSALTRSAWDLSVTMHHSESAGRLDASVAADSTTLLVESLQKLDGASKSHRRQDQREGGG